MIGLKLDAAKKLFFDSDKVLKALGAATARNLNYAANLTKKIAQRSMRSGGKKRKSSLPGQPPRAHGDRLLRRFTVAIYDPNTKAGLAGPTLINGRAKRNHGKTVPETLEHNGGQVDVLEVLYKGEWVNYWDEGVSAKARLFNPTRRRVATVEARPFMRPAEVKARPSYMAKWKDSVRA